MKKLTPLQELKVDKYLREFNDNVAKFETFGSKEDCYFGMYESPNPEDKNITLIITSVSGISDNYQTYKVTNNITIEPDGTAVKLTDVYPKEYVMQYIKTLKKIN